METKKEQKIKGVELAEKPITTPQTIDNSSISQFKKKKQYEIIDGQIDALDYLNTNYPVLFVGQVDYQGLRAMQLNITSRPELDGLLYIDRTLNNLDYDLFFHSELGNRTTDVIGLEAYLSNQTRRQVQNKLQKLLKEKEEQKETNKLPFIFDEKGKIEKCLDNIKLILQQEKIKVRYNEMTKLIDFQGIKHRDTARNATYTHIKDMLKVKYGLAYSKDNMYDTIEAIAIENSYNPIGRYLSKVAKENPVVDGQTPNLRELLNTIEWNTDNIEQINYCRRVLIKWLIGAVKVALSTDKDRQTCEIVPVLQGDQGIGKSKWIQRLVPKEFFKGGTILNLSQKDDIIECLNVWIVELAELGGTFARSDNNKLKAFISRDSDTFRSPYGRCANTYPRRTAFFASINEGEYLTDSTGNRRFISMPVKSMDYEHSVNMDKVWSEVQYLEEIGQIHYLTLDEIKQNEKYNSAFRIKSKHEIILDDLFDWDSAQKGAVTVAKIIDYVYLKTHERITNPKAITTILRLKGCVEERKRIENNEQKRYWIVPFVEGLTLPF